MLTWKYTYNAKMITTEIGFENVNINDPGQSLLVNVVMTYETLRTITGNFLTR
jgi:hypothetical protein